MRGFYAITLVTVLWPRVASALTPAEAADGWIELFDGESLFGWTVEGAGKWRTAGGVLAPDSDSGALLRTSAAFGDFRLKLEFRAPASAAGGLFFRWERPPKSEPDGYEIPINESGGEYPTGSLAHVFKASESRLKPGVWRSLELMADGDHLVVTVDGMTATDTKDARFSTGNLRLQSKPGARIEFRNLRLKPLNLDPLFDGADLAGWKQVAPPPAKPSKFSKLLPIKSKPKPGVWAAEKGSIHAGDGADQLETERTFSDFVLQLQVRADSRDKKHHPDGAILLRGDPGKYHTGYRVVFHNGGAQPSGTLADLQPARKALGEDNNFFLATVAAYGRHFTVWMNGLLVNDYEDRRPDSVARTAAGALALAHAADAVFDFKNIGLETLVKPGAAPELAKASAPANTAVAGAAPAPSAPAMPAPTPPAQSQPASQAEDNARRAKVAGLTSQLVQSSSPEQQVQISKQILELEPDNQVAYSALRSAQEKIDKASAAQAQQENAARQQDAQSQAAGVRRDNALRLAEEALIAGNLKTAADQLAIVRGIAPNDAEGLALSGRVNQAIRDRKTLLYGAAAGALVALGLLIALLWKSRGTKSAYLEIASGQDRGRRFEFTSDVLHIGATAQDNGSKNEVVVADPDRMISRFHCEVHRRGSKFYVFDLKSANGTFVNGRRIQPGKPVRLRGGSRLDLARVCQLRVGHHKRGEPVERNHHGG